RRGADPVGGGVLDAARERVGAVRCPDQRQHVQVGDVGDQIEQADERRAEHQRAGYGPARIAHLAGGEGDVGPRIRGEECPDQRRPQLHSRPGDAEPVANAGRARFAARAAPPPSTRPSAITASKVATLATVNTFCTCRPASRPRAFKAVRSRITLAATACTGLAASGPRRTSGGAGASAGQSCPAKVAKATATAAIVPVWITSTSVQP